jgi:hypothetical protein
MLSRKTEIYLTAYGITEQVYLQEKGQLISNRSRKRRGYRTSAWFKGVVMYPL